MLTTVYILYVIISLMLTVFVGHKLNRYGEVFLLENYADKPELAHAINQMLLVGFYLINLGFICFTLTVRGKAPQNWSEVIEFLSTKIGFIAIILGVMHFTLMLVLQKYSTARGNTVKQLATQA